jgi:hypothetical protein
MVSKRPVSVHWQMLFAIIPLVWVYAFYRIERLILGIIFAVITGIIAYGIQITLPIEFGFVVSWLVSIGAP